MPFAITHPSRIQFAALYTSSKYYLTFYFSTKKPFHTNATRAIIKTATPREASLNEDRIKIGGNDYD
jgi:hypothetical protein